MLHAPPAQHAQPQSPALASLSPLCAVAAPCLLWHESPPQHAPPSQHDPPPQHESALFFLACAALLPAWQQSPPQPVPSFLALWAAFKSHDSAFWAVPSWACAAFWPALSLRQHDAAWFWGLVSCLGLPLFVAAKTANANAHTKTITLTALLTCICSITPENEKKTRPSRTRCAGHKKR